MRVVGFRLRVEETLMLMAVRSESLIVAGAMSSSGFSSTCSGVEPVLNLRTSTQQKCEAIPKRARI